jgi:pantoate--beta-alanine ligase
VKVIRDPRKITKLLKFQKNRGRSIGFVPTMGALHPGHLSLIQQSAKENDLSVVSIFVNPVQFSPQEDLKKYPRPLKNDLALCRKHKVDFVFLPSEKDMYPQGFSTLVEVGGLSDLLCGAFRPGHFRGVAIVLTKLLNIIAPDVLYLGQKDIQQVVIIKRMVKDLNFSVKIKVMPTVRLKSGLAMSSRNLYLNPAEIHQACLLWEALSQARELIRAGNQDYPGIIRQMKKIILKKSPVKIEYISVVDADSLKPVNKFSNRILVALAVWVSKVRLIDNLIVSKNSKLTGMDR